MTGNRNVGIRCPHCDGARLRTVRTKPVAGRRTRRYKTCLDCGSRITTTEVANTTAKKEAFY